MKYDIDHIQELLIERMAGTISDEDNAMLERALAEDPSAQLLHNILADQLEALGGKEFLTNLNAHEAWLRVAEKLTEEIPAESARTKPFIRRLFTFRNLTATAAILIAVSVINLFWLPPNEPHTPPVSANQYRTNEVPTTGDKVVLTLANGKSIVLDNAENGVLMKTGDIEVSKTADGQLLYQVTQADPDEDHGGLNTITTPPGGQYQIILPDNSNVWLNTASSLKFPTVFRGEHREVELIGEAYFEVAKNKDMPFIVKSRLGEIEVLGTGFNVNAYDDEHVMKTTLLEGSVKIKGNETKVLKPGEQAIMDAQSMRVRHVDVSEVTAWKSNLFQFNDTRIETIMREAARWYDLDVRYAGKIPERSFTGKISREVGIAEFFEMLRYAGVNFEVDGKQITVL